MTLYQKYRPTTFKEVYGNTSVVKALKNAVQSENPPHIYLITGNRGVGKTTLAGICKEELKASSIVSLNFAEDGSVERARDLLEDLRYAPIKGNRVIYLLEEFHRASSQAQETFLQVYENTPSYVYFFICTSKPNKVDSAVKSRCSTYHLKDLNLTTLKKILTKVVIQEGIDEKISDEVIDVIASNSSGSARTALQLLDTVMRLDSEEEMLEVASNTNMEDPTVFSLFKALLDKKQWKDVSKVLEQLRREDPESIRYAMLAIAGNSLLKRSNKLVAIIIECFSESFVDIGFPGVISATFQVHNQ